MSRNDQKVTVESLKLRIDQAAGRVKADVIIRGVTYLDVFRGAFATGDVVVAGGRIVAVGEGYEAARQIDGTGRFLVPGFIDAHVHLESSLLTPARYAELVLPRGTTSVIWDPHEIGNALGVSGVAWAIAASQGLPLSVYVMAPSCVPALSESVGLESSGHTLDSAALAAFHDEPRVLGLGEMMNVPGLLMGDPDVLRKLALFADRHIDGHCPGITGRILAACAAAGVGSCHESLTFEEGTAKLAAGLALLVREGSCARNADALLPLLTARSAPRIALCSDDLNPADIARRGHIDHIIDKGLRMGIAPEDIFRSASFAPAQIFGLKGRGAIAPSYAADLVFVAPADGASFVSGLKVTDVMVGGRLLSEWGPQAADAGHGRPAAVRNIRLAPVTTDAFKVKSPDGPQRLRVIEIVAGQIVTNSIEKTLSALGGDIAPDTVADVLKLAVFERYHGSSGHAVGFVKGFGLKEGAIAASISHDAHNVVVVGCTEGAMAAAVNRLIKLDGGIVVTASDGSVKSELALPIGGLLTDAPSAEVVAALEKLKAATHELGSALAEPFLQLAFLSLPVIGRLKLTDKGLVDVDAFRLVPLFV